MTDGAARTITEEQWRSLIAAEAAMFENLAAYLDTEHAEFISEIKTTIGNDITTMAIGRVINRDLFLQSGDAWKIDVRHLLFSAAFGICA